MISSFVRSAWVVVAALLMAVGSASAVGVGDVALIWFAADDPDGLSFVALREIPSGTVIRFTDSGWMNSGTFRANEGGVQYTAASTLSAGTVVSANNPFTSGGWSVNGTGLGTGGFLLSSDGDQVLTFLGDASAPQFINAVHFDSTGYVDATTSNTTGLPTGLTVGSSAVALPEVDNGYYNGPTTGSPEALLAEIGNPANWITSNTRITPPGWSFTITGGAPVVSGVSLAGAPFDLGEMVSITVTLNSVPAAGQPVSVELTSGAFAAPQSLVISNPDSAGQLNVAVVNEGVWTVDADATSGGIGSATSASFTVGTPTFPPTVFAGANRTVSLVGSVVVVHLFDATADDADGLAGATYAWTPATATGLVSWQNRTGAIVETTDPGSATVTLDAVGTYMFTLTVTDGGGLIGTDTLSVQVSEPTPVDDDQYAPPPGYYSAATGQGATLKSQLAQILANGHNEQTYGAFKNSAARYDADPAIAGNILLMYNRASVPGNWNGGATWNREHVWPQSLQPGDASDGTRGNLGDPYILRACDPGINTARGNKPYGNFTTVGTYGSQGAFYFPGDPDKGDAARGLFYSATRYMSALSLVNGAPSGNTMGDLASLVRWNYTDTPDTFERRRGHLIYEDQGNRNAFIDHPEYVWSIFGDGANDSTLYISALEPADGASSLTLDLPPVIVNGPLPASTNVLLRKDGADPTYYSVTSSGDAVASVTGRFNAFDINAGQRTITVGLAASTTTSGVAAGSVVINNLDISTQGQGQGSADADDVINLTLTVYDHAEASFAPAADVNAVTIDFGNITGNAGVQTASFDIHNLASGGPTAALDLTSVQSTGDNAVLTTDLVELAGLPAGAASTWNAAFDPTSLTPATYTAIYTITVADESLPGAAAGTPLVLTLTATISNPASTFDADNDGDVDELDLADFVDCLTGPGGGLAGGACAIHDANGDSDVDLDDLCGFQRAYTGNLP